MHAPSDTARSSWSLRIPAVAPFACERPRALNAVVCFFLRTLAGLVRRRSFGPIVTVALSHKSGCAGQKVAFPKSTTTNELFRKTSLFGCVRCLRCTKIGATSSMQYAHESWLRRTPLVSFELSVKFFYKPTNPPVRLPTRLFITCSYFQYHRSVLPHPWDQQGCGIRGWRCIVIWAVDSNYPLFSDG